MFDMEILIFSDTHKSDNNVNKVIKKHNYDYAFYLGDGVADLKGLELADNVYCVKGNCDFFVDQPYEHIVSIGNKKFMAVHGHTFKVKSGLGALLHYAKSQQVDIVLYGHTHKAEHKVIDGITFINPGALTSLRGNTPSYIILTIDNNKVDIKVLEL